MKRIENGDIRERRMKLFELRVIKGFRVQRAVLARFSP